jgi:hypothetical protein
MDQVLENGASLRRRSCECSLKFLEDRRICWHLVAIWLHLDGSFAILHELVIDSGIDTRT